MDKHWNIKENIQREIIFEDLYNCMVYILALTF